MHSNKIHSNAIRNTFMTLLRSGARVLEDSNLPSLLLTRGMQLVLGPKPSTGKGVIMNIRRTIAFWFTVALVGRLSYQLAWEADLRDRLLDSPWNSVGLLVLSALAIGALIWAIVDPTQLKTLLAFVLGMATALWGQKLLKGISWGQTLTLVGIVGGLVVLWFITTWDEIFGN